MSILDLQARLRRLGNIRMGTKGPKGNPVKLDTWRLTSSDKALLEEAAKVYGGTVSNWSEQFELITGTDTLPVEIAPQTLQANQHLELWSGGGCQRRCNGQTCTVPDNDSMKEVPCICAGEKGDTKCKPHTLVLFFLYELPGLGVWELWSTGWNAANEMAALVPMLQGSGARVTLRMDKRTSKREGQPTHKYVVPVIDANISVGALKDAGGGMGMLPSGPVGALGALGPSAPWVEGDDKTVPVSEQICNEVSVGVGDTVPPPVIDEATTAEGQVGEEPSLSAVTASAEGDSLTSPTPTGFKGYLEQLEERVVQSPEQSQDAVTLHLVDRPDADATMDTNEVWLRKLFRLMEHAGLWLPAQSGMDALHMALRDKHGLSHLGGLRASELKAFVSTAAEKAKEKIGEI